MPATSRRRRSGHARRPLAALGAGLCLLAAPASAYITLDGDRTAWPSSPSYRIINRSPDVAAAASDAAVRGSFDAWAQVQGSDLAFREVNSGGDITVEFVTNGWPPEVGAGPPPVSCWRG